MVEDTRATYVMIGGFLGAGKTTAVARMGAALTERGLKVGLITNGESVSSDVTHKESVAWLTGVSQDDVNEDGKTDTDTEDDD